MNVYKIIITKRAERDLQDIWKYIADDLSEPRIADKLLDRIDKHILNLAEMPKRHKLVSDSRLAMQGVRLLHIGNYTVFYTVAEKEKIVNIIRVLYSRRDWQNLL